MMFVIEISFTKNKKMCSFLFLKRRQCNNIMASWRSCGSLFPFGRFFPKTNFIRSLGQLLRDRHCDAPRAWGAAATSKMPLPDRIIHSQYKFSARPTDIVVVVVYLIFVSTSNKPCPVRRRAGYQVYTSCILHILSGNPNAVTISGFQLSAACGFTCAAHNTCVFRCF